MTKNFYNQGSVNTLFLMAAQQQRVNIFYELLKQFPDHNLSDVYAKDQHIWVNFLKDNYSPWKKRGYEYRHFQGHPEGDTYFKDMVQRAIISLGNPWTTPPFEESALPEILEKDRQRIQQIINTKSDTEPENLIPITIKESPPYLALFRVGSKEADEIASQFLDFAEAKPTLEKWYQLYKVHPISEAVESDAVELVQKYLDMGISPNILIAERHLGNTTEDTSLIAFARSEAMVKTLIDGGFNLQNFLYYGQQQPLLDFWKRKNQSFGSALPKMLNLVLEKTPDPDAAIDAFIINVDRYNITEFKRFYKTQKNKEVPLQVRSTHKEGMADSAYSHFIQDTSDIKTKLGIARTIIEQNSDKLHETTSLGESWITHTLRVMKPRVASQYTKDYPHFSKFGEALQNTTSWKLVFPENLYIPGAQPEAQTVQNIAKILTQLMTGKRAQVFYCLTRQNTFRGTNDSWMDQTFKFSPQTMETRLPEQNITLKEHIYTLYRDYYKNEQPHPLSNPYTWFGGILNNQILNVPLKQIMTDFLSHPEHSLANVTSNASQLLESEQLKFDLILKDEEWIAKVLNKYSPLEKEVALIQLLGTMPDSFNMFNRSHEKVSPPTGLAAALLEHGTTHYIKSEDIDAIKQSIRSEVNKKVIDKAFLNNKINFNSISKPTTTYQAL